MARLSIGERVSDVRGGHEGRLVDIDGGTAYVMQANGVEIEFPLDKLKPYEEAEAKASRSSAGPHQSALDAKRAALLASVPAAIRDAVAQSYNRGADSSPHQPFADLTDDRKFETIRIHLPSLPRQLLSAHLKLVVAFRDIARDTGPRGEDRKSRKA